jgi:DNA (cytosine-5)-methyltransferase 1
MIRHLDLFSGIGGFALAARMVGGIETVGLCEIDQWAQKVLAKNFPNVPIHDDVKTLNPNDYGAIELITGGYPCQPFSLSGKRKGAADDRHLWPEVLRIVADARPRWLLCENVAGHVTMGLDQVLSDLDAIGYSAGTVVIPACAVDAPHRRDRVWIIANREKLFSDGGNNHPPISMGGKSLPESGDGNGAEVMADAKCQRCEQMEQSITSRTNGKATTSQTKHGGFSTGRGWWDPEPAVGRVANGIPRRVDRLRGLGNAIVPQVACEIIRCMIDVDAIACKP